MRNNAYMPEKAGKFIYVSDPKEEWVPVRPGRFVYHLTKGGNRCLENEDLYYQRLSIYLYGLFGKEKGTGGVWANRQIQWLTRTYPILLDGFEWGEKEYINGLEGYDVWRIDTENVGNRWYLDPNMQDCPFFYNGLDYVYTENSISPSALKLFRVEVDVVHFHLYPAEPVRFNLLPVKVS